jgi:hypothetical protein
VDRKEWAVMDENKGKDIFYNINYQKDYLDSQAGFIPRGSAAVKICNAETPEYETPHKIHTLQNNIPRPLCGGVVDLTGGPG